jgi:epsilon-lactone hydrolase
MRYLTVLMLLIATIPSAAVAQPYTSPVDVDGALHLPNGEIIPYSDLASSQARQNFIDITRGYQALLAPKPGDWQRKEGESAADEERRWYDQMAYIPWLTKLRQHFAVAVEPRQIGGVQTDIVEPKEGISESNKYRVLINLHGGGMTVGARYGGQLESIPIASIGRIRVVTVDYRMTPEYKLPAAEDDVISVYRELLETYPAKNIGIYGCSAGAALTGTTVAKLIATGQPRPGAIGMFGSGPFGRGRFGDSNYFFAGGKPIWNAGGGYMAGVDMGNSASYPAESPAVQRRFPPSLLISGTRDPALSSTVFAHSVLVDMGVDAELHVWEGAQHCSFAQPFVDSEVPESQQAWKVIANFFDRHLGRRGRLVGQDSNSTRSTQP